MLTYNWSIPNKIGVSVSEKLHFLIVWCIRLAEKIMNWVRELEIHIKKIIPSVYKGLLRLVTGFVVV